MGSCVVMLNYRIQEILVTGIYYEVADAQALTDNADNTERYMEILSVALNYMACGLDPEKSILSIRYRAQRNSHSIT